MTEHTPAPWEVKTDNVLHRPEIVAQNHRLGDQAMICFVAGFGSADKAQQHFNARLIAAAPDLLAALEDCLAVIMEQIDNETEVCRPGCSTNARAAIAKATKESP